MPPTLKVIFDQFLQKYLQTNKRINNDRDAMIDLYLYFSTFMDTEIKSKRNKYDIDKYTKLKNLGLQFIKHNPKNILKYLKSTTP